MKHYKKVYLGFTITFIALLSFCFLPWVTKALAGGCGRWEGVPTITLKLPGQEKPQHKCEKGKEGAQPQGAKDAKGEEGHKTCMKERCQGCASIENVTLGFGDLEKYHGHVCPGTALGYRATQVALGQLYPGEIPLRGDQFVVSGIPRACPADAISYLTGARYGKGSEGAFNGNLAFDKTIGASSYIFASMTTGKAIKLTTTFQFPKEMEALKAKKDADPDANAQYEAMSRCVTIRILTAPEKEVFAVTPVSDFSWKEYKDKYLK
jgi:formylmethanofuran dehydrogenase subunit E